MERLFLKCGVVSYTVYKLCFNVLLSLLPEAIVLIKRFNGQVHGTNFSFLLT